MNLYILRIYLHANHPRPREAVNDAAAEQEKKTGPTYGILLSLFFGLFSYLISVELLNMGFVKDSLHIQS